MIQIQLNVDRKIIYDRQVISDTFNDYFLSLAEEINMNNSNNTTSGINSYPIDYLSQAFKSPFPNIKHNNTST